MEDYNFIQKYIMGKTHDSQQQINPENFFMTNHMDYVTGRSLQNYLKHLFPNIKSEQKLLDHMKNLRFLDLGSGINHINKPSLLYKLNKLPNTWAKGLDVVDLPKHNNYIKGSLFNTKFRSNSIDIILCQYVLYSHINTVTLIKKALIEAFNILKLGGEMRIYPVYFGNYYLSNENLEQGIL